jgi:hypothetical protein
VPANQLIAIGAACGINALEKYRFFSMLMVAPLTMAARLP